VADHIFCSGKQPKVFPVFSAIIAYVVILCCGYQMGTLVLLRNESVKTYRWMECNTSHRCCVAILYFLQNFCLFVVCYIYDCDMSGCITNSQDSTSVTTQCFNSTFRMGGMQTLRSLSSRILHSDPCRPLQRSNKNGGKQKFGAKVTNPKNVS
jgi:hypothetical protein